MALANDSHLEVVPLLFEDPHGYTMSYEVERFDSGWVLGSLDVPASREREVFHFKGISPSYALFAGSTAIRRILDYYFAGGQIRVYRDYPANVTAWTVDNPSGYSDIVKLDPGGSSYPWYNPAMTIFSFDLDGVAIR